MSIKPKLLIQWAATLCAAFSATSVAQQITHEAKFPKLATTGDGRFLPNPLTPFRGEVGSSARDSRPATIVPSKDAPSSTLRATLIARLGPTPAPPPQRQSPVGDTPVQATTPASTTSPIITSWLGNISTRALVQTGDNVMIGGFIVQGTQPKNVIIRAMGP